VFIQKLQFKSKTETFLHLPGMDSADMK